MDEPPDPIRPGKSKSRETGPPAPAPLPRLWRTEPPPESEEEEEDNEATGTTGIPSQKKKKKRPLPESAGPAKPSASTSGSSSAAAPAPKKKKKRVDDARPVEKRSDGSTKVEETPKYDTYEARQRVRVILGSVLAVAFVLGLILVIRRFRGSEVVEDIPATDPVTQATNQNRQKDEQEAQSLMETARSAVQSGRTEVAVDLFTKLAKAYPNTNAGREAMAALDRHRRKLPLLGKTPDQPTGPQPPPGSKPTVLPANPAATSGPPAMATSVEPLGPKPPPNPTGSPTSIPGTNVAGTAPATPGKPLPPGFRAKPGTKTHETGWPMEVVGLRDTAEMVFIPGGTFIMGRDDGDPAERPAHQVQLAGYYLDRHEVTNRQYAQFVRETGRPEPNKPANSRETPDPPPASVEDLPVTNITARDAKAYCVWAGKTLPTEAQWERAARGDHGLIFPWGNDPPRWDPPRSPRQIDAVMTQMKDISPFGIHDLAGNAWEWTGDLYDNRYFQQFRETIAKDPLGPSQIRARPIQVTVKGGSKDYQVFSREGMRVDQRLPYLSFRGALQAEKPEPPPASPSGSGGGGTGADPSGGGGGLVPF